MYDKEAEGLRKSARIVLKEGSFIETMKLTDADLEKERLKVKCSVVGCTFMTEYLPPKISWAAKSGTLLGNAQDTVWGRWNCEGDSKCGKDEIAEVWS